MFVGLADVIFILHTSLRCLAQEGDTHSNAEKKFQLVQAANPILTIL